MYRLTLAAFVAVLVGVFAAAASAANAPQNAARGSGTTGTTTSQSTPIIGCQSLIVIVGFEFCQIGQVGLSTTTTTTSQSFDFNAKIGSAGIAQGRMRLSYTTETVTSVTRTGPCIEFQGFTCPTPSQTDTGPQSADITANVTCLTVVQNQASIGGFVTKFSGNVAPQRGLLFNATDNTIAKTQTVPDQFDGTLAPDVPYTCPPPTPAQPPITSGDIIVDQG